jgi:hypothetical protein
MFVTVKSENKKIKVDVSEKNCPLYACFSPHHYQHRSYNLREGSMTWVDKYYSCSYRNYHGCPDVKIRKEKT